LEKIAKGFGLEIHELLAPAFLPRVNLLPDIHRTETESKINH